MQLSIGLSNYSGINAASAAIANFHPVNARTATRRYTSVKVNRRVLLFAGLLCLRKLRIRATIIVTSVTYSPGLMAVTMAATPARAGVHRSLGRGPREEKSRGVCKRVRARGDEHAETSSSLLLERFCRRLEGWWGHYAQVEESTPRER